MVKAPREHLEAFAESVEALRFVAGVGIGAFGAAAVLGWFARGCFLARTGAQHAYEQGVAKP
jgi:hypothetical protein